MKKMAYKLAVGDVVASGERVTSVAQIGHFQNKKVSVGLVKPSGERRLACWGYYSTIFMRQAAQEQNSERIIGG